MRAIVSLMKFFVGAAFLIYTTGLAFLLGASLVGFSDSRFAIFGGIGIYIAIIGFVSLVLFTGMVALLISGHDRLCDLALLMRERNDLLRAGRFDEDVH